MEYNLLDHYVVHLKLTINQLYILQLKQKRQALSESRERIPKSHHHRQQ